MIRTILVACLVSICCFISGGVETAVTTQSPQLQTNATKEAITQSPQLKTNATKVAITQSPQLKTNVTKEAITQSPQLQTNVTKAATTQLPQLQTDVTKRATTKLPQPQTNVTKATTIKLPQPQTNATKAATTKLSQPQTNVTKAIHADGITSNIIYTKVSSSPLGNLNNANTSKTFWNLFGALNNTNITKVIGSLFENLNKTNISKDLENLFAAFDNKNVTNALGNATEALNKLFGDGNGMAGVAKVMESLLGNGNTMAGISKAIGELLGNGNGIAGIAGTIEKIFGNGKGMAGIDQTIGKLLENGNGMEGLAKAINGLFGVANGSNIAKTIEGLLGSVNSSGTGKTSSLGSLQVNPVIGSLTKLLPFVFEFLTSGFKALEEKNVSKACMADLYMWKDGLQLYQGWAWKCRLVKAVLAFSAYSNSRKLLATKQASGSLSAINGIRFLSMAWVILGHTYYFGMNYTSNKFDFGKTKLNQYLFFAIINATPSVDSFFALSGCLVAYLTLREIKKVGGVKKLNWAMFYFHRFWRLTPPYMLIILVGTILYRYIGNGALQTGEDSMFMHNCRKTWWTNLLYVNNFVKTDEMCMGWSWYLANDMQMYVLSPLILIPFFYNKIFGWIVSAIFLISTIVTTSVIAHGHEYPVQSFSQYAPTKPDKHYEELMYIPVYTRIGPYIVGLITGYILYKCKCKCKIPKWVNFCCWFMCLLVCTLIIYGPYTYEDNHIMSTNESTAFYALFRTGWGMAVCWVIFACATGNGGFVNDVLSWSPYVPLGRLTYCAYLLHPLIMLKYYENRMQPLYFTDYDTVYYFLGNLVLSYGAAFVTSLFFESPMMGLEKAIFNK